MTYGSRGIGRAIALVCAAEGANIALCARSQEGIDLTVAEVQAQGVRAFGLVADVTQAESVEHFVHTSAEAIGNIDILVNNVGGSKGNVLMGSSDDEWMRTFDINVFHAVRASRAVFPTCKNVDRAPL